MKTSIRAAISSSYDDVVVYAMDVMAEPCRNAFLKKNPYIQAKCSRALPIASRQDIVVLAQKPNQEYLEWLRSLGLGPEVVVSYDYTDAKLSLSELIIRDPKPVLDAIKATGRDPILVPFFSGKLEEKAAEILGARLFASKEEITMRFFNKENFKKECASLHIPLIEGVSQQLRDDSQKGSLSASNLEMVVSELLDKYTSVIVRGTEGSAGSSLYTIERERLKATIGEIIEQGEERVLIEPFLDVIASPNDQWIIGEEGQVHHFGLTAQLFEGLRHMGNLKGQYFSDRVVEYITQISTKIALHMSELGYRGVMGVDYIVAGDGIFPIENNARMNGSSFTIAIEQALEPRHGEIPCWKFFKAKTEPCSFKELCKRMEPILYDGTGINAVFPYDCDTVPLNGAFTPIIFAEDLYHIEHLESALRELGIARE